MSLHDSSIVIDPVVSPPGTRPQHEWDVTGWIPDKPAGVDYGFVVKGQTISSTPKDLLEVMVQRRGEISFVWTPETPQPVRPEQVPFLTEAFRRVEVGQARNFMLWGALMLVLGLGIALVSPGSKSLTLDFITIAGGLGLAVGNWKYWRARKYTQEDAIVEASDTRFRTWIQERSMSGYTLAILASIVVVSIFGGIAVDATALAGLVKPAVFDGEVWRLFTAPLLHPNFQYLFVVAFALIWLSKVIEQTAQRAFVPLLFLVGAVVGSLLSMELSPDTNSIGASGGIMALLGFIVVAAYRERTKFPPRFFKRMITATACLGSLGFFGVPFIDNGAHLGGMVTGMVLGWLCTGRNWPPLTGSLLRLAGVSAAIVVVYFALFAIGRLLS